MNYLGKSACTLAVLTSLFGGLAPAAELQWEMSTAGSGGLESMEIRLPANTGRGKVIEEHTRFRSHPIISIRRPRVITIESIRPARKTFNKSLK